MEPFPPYLEKYLRDGVLEVMANGRMLFRVRGACRHGGGLELEFSNGEDAFSAVMRGSRAAIEVVQGRDDGKCQVALCVCGRRGRSRADGGRHWSGVLPPCRQSTPELRVVKTGSPGLFLVDLPLRSARDTRCISAWWPNASSGASVRAECLPGRRPIRWRNTTSRRRPWNWPARRRRRNRRGAYGGQMLTTEREYYAEEALFHGFVPRVMGTRFDLLIAGIDSPRADALWERNGGPSGASEPGVRPLRSRKRGGSGECLGRTDPPVAVGPELGRRCSSAVPTASGPKGCSTSRSGTSRAFVSTRRRGRPSFASRGEDLSLDFGGFAKGYRAEEARRAAAQRRVSARLSSISATAPFWASAVIPTGRAGA